MERFFLRQDFLCRKTSPEVASRPSGTPNMALQFPVMKVKLAEIGAHPDSASPKRFGGLMCAELRHASEVIRISGAMAEQE